MSGYGRTTQSATTPTDLVKPWELLGENPRLDGHRPIVSRRYRLPSGQESDWEILNGSDSVAIVALTRDHRVITVRQFRPGPGKVLVELPGGNVDPGESRETTAIRELQEETGYQAESLEIIGCTWLAGYATNKRYAAIAQGCRNVAEPQPDSEEFLDIQEMSMPEFVEHALSGELTDQDIALRALVHLGILSQSG